MSIEEIVSRADLFIEGTVKRSEGGIPIGNGNMGTLVWTSPSAIKMQINRNDVFANDSYSNSFNERHLDYSYACAFVDIDFADFTEDIFTGKTRQHLHLYTAEGAIEGEGAGSSFFACTNRDAFVFSCFDKRRETEGINIRIKMLRPAEVKTKNHLAVSRFIIKEDAVILKQEFTEGNYYCASAVAVSVSGRKFRIRQNNESGGLHPGIPNRRPIVLGMDSENETRICLEPGKGEFDVYISSAAAFDRSGAGAESEDVAEKALELLRQTRMTGKSSLKADSDTFWKNFWEKSFIELSGDAEAELVEQHYQYYMYILACCSQNSKYPPNYGGMLFSTRGDLRHWGAMQWWNNLQLYYNAVMASGHYELVMPFFSQWNTCFERFAIAARQQWGASGIFIPETVGFDGPEVLPETIAAELRDLMLYRKKWKDHSEEFWQFAMRKRPHECRWNFRGMEKWEDGILKNETKGTESFGSVTHMLGSQAGIAYLYWDYYCFSGDRNYLETYGYPIIKGVAEFFRTFPNLIKGDDGLYHIYYTNHSEGYYGSTDSMESVTAMYGILPIAIRAAGILGIDADLCAKWGEVLEHLTPLPSFDRGEGSIWSGAAKELFPDPSHHQRPVPLPCRMFNLCTLETEQKNPEIFAAGKRTVDWGLARNTTTSGAYVYEMSSMGQVLANMGRAQEMAEVIVGQINCINAAKEYCYYEDNGSAPVFENRLTAREGINAMSGQRLGNAAAALQLALLQSGGGTPAGDPVIRLFPALPKRWDARFKLYARGGFIVETSCKGGVPGKAVFTSILGQKLVVHNVWGKCLISINGKDGTLYEGELIEIPTISGDKIEFVPV
jgi:hypothetical protein